MIFYPLACNDGGMLRVAEALIKMLRDDPQFPLSCVILSEKRPDFLEDLPIPWIPWSDKLNMMDPRIGEIKREIETLYRKRSYQWIIYDLMTAYFTDHLLGAKFCYDVHFLCRPFYTALGKQKDLKSTNELFGLTYSFNHQIAELTSIKNESGFIRRAQVLLSNSRSSTLSLKTNYKDCVGSKLIYEIPVSTDLTSEITSEEDYLLYNGRFHVQKGLHFLVHHHWSNRRLIMKGLSKNVALPSATQDYLGKRNISVLPFGTENSETAKVVAGARAVLFPSIYEPWGLSLQEALSMGKLCIAHRCDSGHEEQIVDGVNGFLLDFSRPDLVEKIESLLTLPVAELDLIKFKAKQMAPKGHQERHQRFKKVMLDLLHQG